MGQKQKQRKRQKVHERKRDREKHREVARESDKNIQTKETERFKIRSLVQKLEPLETCQFSNCSHLIASHCMLLTQKYILRGSLRENIYSLHYTKSSIFVIRGDEFGILGTYKYIQKIKRQKNMRKG